MSGFRDYKDNKTKSKLSSLFRMIRKFLENSVELIKYCRDFSKARDYLLKAMKLDPKNSVIKNTYEWLTKNYENLITQTTL